jgi:hypothetical protein
VRACELDQDADGRVGLDAGSGEGDGDLHLRADWEVREEPVGEALGVDRGVLRGDRSEEAVVLEDELLRRGGVVVDEVDRREDDRGRGIDGTEREDALPPLARARARHDEPQRGRVAVALHPPRARDPRGVQRPFLPRRQRRELRPVEGHERIALEPQAELARRGGGLRARSPHGQHPEDTEREQGSTHPGESSGTRG